MLGNDSHCIPPYEGAVEQTQRPQVCTKNQVPLQMLVHQGGEQT